MTLPSESEFIAALAISRRPGGRQAGFPRAHSQAAGKEMTASQLSDSVKYRDYRPIDLHYGQLARNAGSAMGIQDAPLQLLVDVRVPAAGSRGDLILIMRPEFEAALKAAGWP